MNGLLGQPRRQDIATSQLSTANTATNAISIKTSQRSIQMDTAAAVQIAVKRNR